MQIKYKNHKLEKICTIYSTAEKAYGPEMAKKIHLRIDQITAADTVEELIDFKMGRCHKLKGDRKGQYAMDLDHPYRLIFNKIGNEIQIVKIIDIVDYH